MDRLNFDKFPREENLKQQWLIKIKHRNLQSIQHARMNHTYCISLNLGCKKILFQLALNKTFCPTPQPLTHQLWKQHQRTKTNKTMLSALITPLIGFPHKVQYQNWKVNKYFVLMVSETGLPVLESITRISKFYALTDSEHKLNKIEIENWLPINYNLGLSWLGTCSHNHYTMFIC